MISLPELDAILQGVSGPPEGVRVLQGASYTPSSNTGCIALIDYLSVSVPLISMPRFNRNDLGSANRLTKQLFTSSSLIASDFDDRGFLGYRFSSDLYGPECEQPCGKIAFGGNADTLLISLSGAGTPFIGSHAQCVYDLGNHDAKITRIDIAHDDFIGELPDVHAFAALARSGFFNGANGQVASRRFIDDLGTGAGSSLYIGKKGDKELNLYEKGKEQGDPLSPWLRFEGRLWAKNRRIPLDAITNGREYLIGAYPQLLPYLPTENSKRCELTRKKVAACAIAQATWLENACGRTLGLLQRSMPPAQFDVYIQSLSRSGLPKRFKDLPESVVKILIQDHANKETMPNESIY